MIKRAHVGNACARVPPSLFKGGAMLLVVAATVVLVFSKACFIILTPNILDESETGLDKSTTGADTGGREAAVA